MSENKDPFMKGAVWFGLVLLLPGAVWFGLVLLLPSAAGMFAILNADAETFDLAPRWIVFSSVLLFFNTGIVVGLMDTGFNDYRETWWLSYLHGLAGLSIPLIFLMLFNWVSFGPGEREFSGGISIPFLSISFDRAASPVQELRIRRPDQIIGRIFFAIPTLFMDLILFLVLYQMIAEFFGKKVDFLEVDEGKENEEQKEQE